MNQNDEAKQRLMQRGNLSPEKTFRPRLDAWYEKNAQVLSGIMRDENIARELWLCSRNVLSANPKLLTCDPTSFATCLVMCAQMRLFPGPAQEVGLVPISGQVQWWPMYKGLVKLGVMSGQVSAVDTVEVYETDEFDITLGLKPNIHHKPNFRLARKDKGGLLGCYAWYDLTQAKRRVFEWMSWEDIQEIKRNSPAVKQGRPSAWTSGYLSEIEMGKKTVLKRGFKTIPTSHHLATAIAIDDYASVNGALKTARVSLDGVFDPNTGLAITPDEGVHNEPANNDPHNQGADDQEHEQPKAIEHRETIEIPVSQTLAETLSTLNPEDFDNTIRPLVDESDTPIELPELDTKEAVYEVVYGGGLQGGKSEKAREFERIKKRAEEELGKAEGNKND